MQMDRYTVGVLNMCRCNAMLSVILSGSQWFSMATSDSSGSQWFLVVLNGSQWLLIKMVPSGSQWQPVIPVVLNGS